MPSLDRAERRADPGTGIGLRAIDIDEAVEDRPALDFLEVHA